MANKNLYRKYRPSNFDELVGQEYIKKTIMNAIKNERISHAYLFSGPRGTGKTSFAKLFAKAINCLNIKKGEICNNCEICEMITNNEVSDIIEMDAASNNGVDEIREIRNAVNILPTKCRYKVYIIDEVHMLSTGAFNALLKTLEEPPNHVIFILATTEPQKLPLTIISRCQNFDFKKLSVSTIKERLKKIIEEERMSIDDEALEEIAKYSDGGLRDAIGLLDQLASYCEDKIKSEDVYELTGGLSEAEIENFVIKICDGDFVSVYNKINDYYENGKDFARISEKILLFLKDYMISQKIKKDKTLANDCKLQKTYNLVMEEKEAYEYIQTFNRLFSEMKKTTHSKIIFEIEILKLVDNKFISNGDEIPSLIEPIEIKNNKENIMSDIKKNVPESAIISIQKEELETLEYIPIDKRYKDILINNTVAMSEKKYKEDLTKKWGQLRTLLLNKELKEAAKILLDANIVAVSCDHLFVTYKYQSMVQLFDQHIDEIGKVLKYLGLEKSAVVSINEEEWNLLRPEYVKLKKENRKIELLDENFDKKVVDNKIANSNKRKKSSDLKEIKDLFDEKIIEVKG